MDWLDSQRVIRDLQIQSIIFFSPQNIFSWHLSSPSWLLDHLLLSSFYLARGAFSLGVSLPLFSPYLVISGFLLLILSSSNPHLLFEWVHPRFSIKAPDPYNPGLLSLHTWLHCTHPHLRSGSPSHPHLSHPVCSCSSFWKSTELRVPDAQHLCTVNHSVPLSLTVFHLFHPYCCWFTSGPFPFVRNIGQG